MSDYGLPVVFAAFVWWFTTGLILLLDGLPSRTFRWSLLASTAIAAFALWGLRASSAHTDVGSAYCAFASAILVWGWQEMAFLTGAVTGPRRTACPPGCRGWPHFVHAVQAIAYHEVAIIASFGLVVAASWQAPNQVGLWTFGILWVMRTSAKLNLFLGVRNTSEELLPEHLGYMKSFFARKPMNLLFPLSVTGGTVLTAFLIARATASSANAFDIAASMLLAALTGLAVLEHWFLMLPLPSNALWEWALQARRKRDDARRRDRAGTTRRAIPPHPGVTPT